MLPAIRFRNRWNNQVRNGVFIDIVALVPVENEVEVEVAKRIRVAGFPGRGWRFCWTRFS